VFEGDLKYGTINNLGSKGSLNRVGILKFGKYNAQWVGQRVGLGRRFFLNRPIKNCVRFFFCCWRCGDKYISVVQK
jgi:hypothetical protein